MLTEFVPHRPLDELIEQGRGDVSSFDTYFDLRGDSILADLPESQQLLMRQDPDVTLKFLKSEDPRQRMAGLYLVYFYWVRHPHFASTCLHLAFHDSVKEARGLALLCLHRLREFINDSRGQLRRLLQAIQPGNDNAVSERYERERADARTEFDEMNLTDWRENVGPLLDDMLTSAEKTEAYLHDQSEPVRYVALSLFTYHWTATPNAVACALSIANDSSSSGRLRGTAIGLLGHCFEASNDRELGSLLASIVVNESEETSVRRIAYYQLYFVRGIPVLGIPEWSTLTNFPTNVDWDFVRSFLRNVG